MQAELIGDFPQRERPHREVTVLKEILLPRNHCLGDPLNREEALLEVAHQPASLLQMLCEQRGFAVAGMAEAVRILLVDADARVDGRS